MTETMPRAPRLPGPLSPLGIAVIGAMIILDQAAKWLAETQLPLQQPIEVLPILSFYLTYNTGIAFSLFAGLGSTELTIGTLAITALVLAFWTRSREGGRLAAVGFALIVGGALGNLIDRLLYGHVIDFLLLHFDQWELFVFNLADVALTAGPGALMLGYLLERKAPAAS